MLGRSGIGAIMDYAAEADLTAKPEVVDDLKVKASARAYDYVSEAGCDANLANFIACIDAVHVASPGGIVGRCGHGPEDKRQCVQLTAALSVALMPCLQRLLGPTRSFYLLTLDGVCSGQSDGPWLAGLAGADCHRHHEDAMVG